MPIITDQKLKQLKTEGSMSLTSDNTHIGAVRTFWTIIEVFACKDYISLWIVKEGVLHWRKFQYADRMPTKKLISRLARLFAKELWEVIDNGKICEIRDTRSNRGADKAAL